MLLEVPKVFTGCKKKFGKESIPSNFVGYYAQGTFHEPMLNKD